MCLKAPRQSQPPTTMFNPPLHSGLVSPQLYVGGHKTCNHLALPIPWQGSCSPSFRLKRRNLSKQVSISPQACLRAPLKSKICNLSHCHSCESRNPCFFSGFRIKCGRTTSANSEIRNFLFSRFSSVVVFA